jgi:hypothetical protein
LLLNLPFVSFNCTYFHSNCCSHSTGSINSSCAVSLFRHSHSSDRTDRPHSQGKEKSPKMFISRRSQACGNMRPASLSCLTKPRSHSILKARPTSIHQLSPQLRPFLTSLSSASADRAVRQILELRGPISHSTFSSPTRISLASPLTLQSSSTSTRQFSSTSAAMAATKIDGTAIAKKIREKLHAEIEATQKSNPRYKPSLKIIQGNFPHIPYLHGNLTNLILRSW